MKKLNKKGFTLIELLAVIVVTSLVLGLSGYGIINAYKKTKDKTIVLNDTSILEAARIYSSESDAYEWKELNNTQYFCTTIQRLKNAGLLKKEAMSEEHEDSSIITVARDATKYTINSIDFLNNTDIELINLCNIKFFTIHYEYNADGAVQSLPRDQKAEVCTEDNCIGANISSLIPKREGYRFVSWNTEADGTGTSYSPGEVLYYYSEDRIVLYAQWKEDSYIVKYNGNGSGVTGSTPDTKCYRNKSCTLAMNGFAKENYDFISWNTKSDGTGTSYNGGEAVTNITASKEKTLYAIWKTKYKVIIKYNVGTAGEIRETTTSNTGINYRWKTAENGTISRAKGNDQYSDIFFTINYGERKNLLDYNNSKYMYITNTNNYPVSLGSVWRCISGQCQDNTYTQDDLYDASSFCNAESSDCTVELAVNWEMGNLLSPIITPSDGIACGSWHSAPYTLNISSENTGTVDYVYKVNNGSFQNYSNPITPPEGISTYVAKTKVGTSYSGEVSCVSKLDTSPPSVPTIDNPTNGNWTNQGFSLTLHSSDSGSGIAYYQYRYEGQSWHTYANSDSDTFETTPFSAQRNELVYFRACDKAGNCSGESSTYIRIDKTAPTINFEMKKGTTKIEPTSNYYSLVSSSVPKWVNYSPTLIWTASDSDSGVSSQGTISYNASGSSTLSTNINYTTNISGSNGVFTSASIDNGIIDDGYRYIKISVCDVAGNCSDGNVFLRVDKVTPTFSLLVKKKSGDNYVNASSNEYSTSQSTAPNWVSAPSFKFIWTPSDSMSGINVSLENNLQYNDAGNRNLIMTNMTTKTVQINSDGTFELIMSSQGYRYTNLKICDNAGNCTVSNAFVRLDNKGPTITLTVKNGNNTVSSSSNEYSTSQSSVPKWIKYNPILVWTASDSMSGEIKSQGTISYNASGSKTLSTNINYSTNITGSNGAFSSQSVDNGGINDGYRYIKMKICDTLNNCSESGVYLKVDKTKPKIDSFTVKNGDSTVSSSSNEYSTGSASSSLKWVNHSLKLIWNTSDSMSGVNLTLENNFSFNATGLSTLNTTINSTSTRNGTGGVFDVTMSSDGYRYVKFKLCDNAGNCADDYNVYLKIDKTKPSISFKMFEGSTELGSSNYSNSASSSLPWRVSKPTLKWYVTDEMSGVNTAGHYSANAYGNQNISEDFVTNNASLTGTLSDGKYVFTVGDASGGYRKFMASVCDNAGNCVTNTKYFKYYGNDTVTRYTNAPNSLNCYSTPSSSSTKVESYSCGTSLTKLKKTYTGNWYYNFNKGCYVSGDYLQTSSPSCSSGGGSGGNTQNYVIIYPNCGTWTNVSNKTAPQTFYYTDKLYVSTVKAVFEPYSGGYFAGICLLGGTTYYYNYIGTVASGHNYQVKCLSNHVQGTYLQCECNMDKDCKETVRGDIGHCSNGLCVWGSNPSYSCY